MASTMPEAVYSRDQVEQYQQKLEQLSQLPRTTFTKKQVVETLMDAIEKALLTRSYEEVAAGLKEEGLDISAGSLKQYVSKLRRAQKAVAGTAGRKRTAKAKKDSSNRHLQTKATANDSTKANTSAKAIAGGKAKRFIEMDEEL